MLNLAGREYDFGPVLYTVLQDCEHRRRSLPPDDGEAAARFAEVARQRLAEIQPCYREAGGTPAYWRELESEVLETALPQYSRAAAAQTRLEQSSYGLWRQGDPVSRLVLGLAGLGVGGLIVKAPFIPIFEDAFAFALATAAFLYPEIKRLVFDWRYSRLLNRLIVQAESYQHRKLPYLSEAGLEAELRAVGTLANAAEAANAEDAKAGGVVVGAKAGGEVGAKAGGEVGATAGGEAGAVPGGKVAGRVGKAPMSIFTPAEGAPPAAPDVRLPHAAGGAQGGKPAGGGPRSSSAGRR